MKIRSVFIIIIFIFLLLTPQISTSQNEKKSVNDSVDFLFQKLFPSVEQFIVEEVRKKKFDKDKLQPIVDKVYDLIQEVIEKEKTIFDPGTQIVKVERDMFDIYVLEVQVLIIDLKESVKEHLLNTSIFRKRFILYIDYKNKKRIEV